MSIYSTLLDLFRNVSVDDGGTDEIRVTGTGAGGTLPVSGTVTSNQGTPNTSANGWPVKPTDGTNSQSFTAAGEAKTQIVDGSSNVVTSTSVPGLVESKRPVDINIVSSAVNKYMTFFSIRQTATTVAAAMVWSMRNASASTKNVYIQKIVYQISFDNPTPALVFATLRYQFQRFSTATPTGGTAQTVLELDNSNAATQVTDVRVLNTGLTTTGVVLGEVSLITGVPQVQGSTNSAVIDNIGLMLAPGEGLAIILNQTAAIGQSLNGCIVWSER